MATITLQTAVTYHYRIMELEQLPDVEATLTILESGIPNIEQAIARNENLTPRANCTNFIELDYTIDS